jgi:YbgC/YbaW family acyl-CoA thioester hydrolase
MVHFTTERRVQFFETDLAGIVHFANFYRWMEETEHEFFRSLGLTIMQPQGDGRYLGWPRVSASCTFERPAYYEDRIEARLSVERIGAKSLTYVVEFWKAGQRIAHGRMKTACCLCGHGVPLESVLIPAEYLARLPPVEAGST